jgi:hypothetical protein
MDREPTTESVPRKPPWEISIGPRASRRDQNRPFLVDSNERNTVTLPQATADSKSSTVVAKQFRWGRYCLSYFVSFFLVLFIAVPLGLRTKLQGAGDIVPNEHNSVSVPEASHSELAKEENIPQIAKSNPTSQTIPQASKNRATIPYWYRLNFEEHRDGTLPADWQVENGVWVDWQAGIPALTIRAGNGSDGKLTIPTRPLGSDFFFEVQLAGTTSSETRFRWTGRDTSSASEIRCIASHNFGWQVAYQKESVADLRFLHYSAVRGTWFYFQNVATGVQPGLYLMIDGVASTRVRLGEPVVGQYDALEIGFSAHHTSRIQNLRWGWLDAKGGSGLKADGLQKEDVGRGVRIGHEDFSPFVTRNAESLRLHSKIGQPPPQVIQAELDLDSPGLTGVAIAFIGERSTPTLAMQFDLLRANQVNAPVPGSIDLRNRNFAVPLRGPKRANVEVREGQLRLAVADNHIYSVPIATAIRCQAFEVDLFGRDLSAFIDRHVAP